ncbi:hypothetical protein MHIB_05070 [Mycolicibacter hiberniae]|uniref:Uncharacterized protein n=1 Tax=Mycolicibacter hiberniae TaxID=29314 RepID=A0A7I7WWV1_9MYCO|nr:hypothetical protein MHIB_05070 [Mycolicibacter hiberniae]
MSVEVKVTAPPSHARTPESTFKGQVPLKVDLSIFSACTAVWPQAVPQQANRTRIAAMSPTGGVVLDHRPVLALLGGCAGTDQRDTGAAFTGVGIIRRLLSATTPATSVIDYPNSARGPVR